MNQHYYCAVLIVSLAMLLVILQNHYLGNPFFSNKLTSSENQEPSYVLIQRFSKKYLFIKLMGSIS
jgi:hypothetical protein